MTIQTGDRLPNGAFKFIGEQGPTDRATSEIFGGRKVVMFAVPGAYTPTCNLKHLPNFIENSEVLKSKGVDEIVCVSVNDPFVMKAWGEASGASGKVTMLADYDGAFTKSLGLDFDGSGAGLGVRSKRYAMLVEDGIVKALNVEDAPATMDASSAERILTAL